MAASFVVTFASGCAHAAASGASRSFFEQDFDEVTYAVADARLWEAAAEELRNEGYVPSTPRRDDLAPSWTRLITEPRERHAKYGLQGIPVGSTHSWYELRAEHAGGRTTLRAFYMTDEPGSRGEVRARHLEYCVLRHLDPARADVLARRWRERIVAAQGHYVPLFDGARCTP